MTQSYQNLASRFQQIYRLQHLGSLASWDQAAMMPPGGNQARGDALAELNALLHNLLTAPEVGDWIHKAMEEELEAESQTSLKEMEREWRHASVIPDRLVKAKTQATSQCEHAWRSQRPENDWQGFASNLKQVVNLTREKLTSGQNIPDAAPTTLYWNCTNPAWTPASWIHCLAP